MSAANGSASRTLAPFGRRSAAVVESRALGGYRLLTVLDAAGPRPDPGQFYMLSTAERWGSDGERPYLPRAFSHARVREGDGGSGETDGGSAEAGAGLRLDFLLEDVGPGTERLARTAAGEEVRLVGPLGIGFAAPGGSPPGSATLSGSAAPGSAAPGGSAATGSAARSGFAAPVSAPSGFAAPVSAPSALLVGGGIGAAPILALSDELGPSAPVMLGFRNSDYAEAASLFDAEPALATDDGSAGRHALVTELLREALDEAAAAPGSAPPTVFACGPPPMLEAVRALCAERDVPAQLAMESGMACGFGACFGCVVPTRDGYVRLCVDGPVLDASELETALVAGAGH
ncbi:MAG TPA: hypothetical protein VF517_06345 [Thermoleophilaceae bacterium]